MGSTRETAVVVGAYTPVGVPDVAGAFARSVVAAAGAPNATRAKAWLYATSRIGGFALSVGVELEPAVVLSTSLIERFIASIESTGLSHATRRTLRSNLVALAACVEAGPARAPLCRERAKAAYSAGEIAAYLALADTQPTLVRRMRASGLICLGAGAGLVGTDLRAVRGVDVAWRSGGVVVEVSGRRPRVVPVLAAYHDRLQTAASFFEERFIIGGVEASRRNVTTPLISSLSGGSDLPRLEMGRLRSTWLGAVAEGIGLRAFMDAAGITCSQRLGDIVATLAAVGEEETVSLLGGRC